MTRVDLGDVINTPVDEGLIVFLHCSARNVLNAAGWIEGVGISASAALSYFLKLLRQAVQRLQCYGVEPEASTQRITVENEER